MGRGFHGLFGYKWFKFRSICALRGPRPIMELKSLKFLLCNRSNKDSSINNSHQSKANFQATRANPLTQIGAKPTAKDAAKIGEHCQFPGNTTHKKLM